MSVLAEVTGAFGSGEVGASAPLELEGGGFVLFENGESVTLEQTADTEVTASANVSPAGVSATGTVGTVVVTGTANVFPTGASATGAVGTVAVVASANVLPTGVAGRGATGRTLVWSSVVPGSDALWLPIGRFLVLLEDDGLLLQEPEPGDVVLIEASTDGARWSKVDTNTDDIWTPVAA